MNKMNNIFIVVIAVFVVSCVSQKNKASYMEIYHKLHRELTLIQTVAHGSAREIDNQFTQTRTNAHNKLVQDRSTWKNILSNQEQETLSMLSMDSDIYQVERCINDSKNLADQLIQQSEEGFNNCSNLFLFGLTAGKSVLNDLYSQHQQEYQNLENVNYYCSEFYAQKYNECLYNQYYLRTKEINDLKKVSGQIVEQYFAIHIKEGDSLLICIDNIIINAHQQVNNIVDTFNTCTKNVK